MRLFSSALALVLFAAPAWAQYGPSNFSTERWDEDYSYLKNAPDRSDPLNALKYIPVNRDGDWYLSLGGQARYRFDYFNNSGFGNGYQDETGFDLVRLLAHLDAHFGKNVRVFLQ